MLLIQDKVRQGQRIGARKVDNFQVLTLELDA